MTTRVYELSETHHIDEFISTFSTCVLFVTGDEAHNVRAYNIVEKVLVKRHDLFVGLVIADKYPEVASYVLRFSSYRQNKTQFLLFFQAKFTLSYWDWTHDSTQLEAELLKILGQPPLKIPESCSQGCGCINHKDKYFLTVDITSHIFLLESFIQGVLDEKDFSVYWTTLLEKKCGARTPEEYHKIHSLLSFSTAQTSLKQRSAELLASLTQIEKCC